jgi:hypothetical protein
MLAEEMLAGVTRHQVLVLAARISHPKQMLYNKRCSKL